MAGQGGGCAIVVALLVSFLVSGSQAAQHKVGGSQGWNLQVDYGSWASQIKFNVGDTLVFTYNAEEHNVLQVSEADYQSCTLTSPIKTWADGNTVVTLSDATSYYFLCGIPSHCTSGMKVGVTVLAASAPAATPPVATPPPSSPPATPPPVSPPATPPPTTPPVAAPLSSPPPAPLSSPPPASAPPPSPSSSPTPSPATPSPSSSPAPSPATTPTPSPASSISPSSPTSSVSTPTSPSGPATSPSASNAYASVTAHVFIAITSAAFVGALLL